MSFKPYGDARSDYIQPEDWQSLISTEDWEENLVDISSYVPIDIRMKQMEQAGIKAQLNSSQFTISELRQIYDNHDFDYTLDDDIEDMIVKDRARNELRMKILAQKAQQSNSGLAPDKNKDVPKEEDVSDSGEAKN